MVSLCGVNKALLFSHAVRSFLAFLNLNCSSVKNMSTKTPIKSKQQVNNLTYSSVILPDSPSAASPQKNLTGLPRVAKDIIADVYNNIQKWNDSHMEGGKIVKNICNLKADQKYPPGLEEEMQDLYNVVHKISIYANALVFLNSQIKALVKLHKDEFPLFVSMNVEQLSDLVYEVSKAYKAELKVKEYVMENIAHSASKSEAMFHAACWVHQQHITSNIKFKLETLLTETGHRKTT